MPTSPFCAAVAAVVALFPTVACAYPADVVKPAEPAVAVPFEPSCVRLLPGGPFYDNMVADQRYLLSLDPDRLLSRFRSEAGLAPRAKPYGGWEAAGVAGHTLGHYLSACAFLYADTGERSFLDRVNHIVDELAECQDHLGTGYVSGIPDWRNAFGNLKQRHGAMIGWVPWYTFHKELAGLRDAHLYCDNAKAKQVLVKLADWVAATVAPLTDAEMQTMLDTEQGGMAESLADAYALTGNAKYLALAKRFTHHAVIDPLVAGTDRLTGLHANTQVPKLIGAERIATLTGDAGLGRAAAFFWQTVVDNRTFATGGNGDGEHFFDPPQAARHLTAGTAETCNVYNMLKLTRELYTRHPRPAYADYAERALFNQILGSIDPRRGMFTYHQSLRSGGFKIYNDPTNAFWCCTGTGMENHARYADAIYFHSPDGAADPALWVDLFIPSRATWAERGVTVEQQTKYPNDGTTKLTVTAKEPTDFALRLRVPGWVKGDVRVEVNGGPVASTREAGAVVVKRTWATGDTVTYRVPMELRVEPLEGAPSVVTFLYGPSVLAADLGTELLNKVNFYETNENRYYNYPGAGVAPVLVGTGDQLVAQPTKVTGEPLTFRVRPAGATSDLTLRPYARTHFVRFAVYFPTYATQADYDHHADELAAAAVVERKLAARTIDDVHPGEQQSEVIHALRSAKSRTGPHRDRHWRDALSGGFFEYTVKVPPGPAELAVTYWGEDVGRTFDVLVDGHKVATQTLSGDHPDAFFDQTYPLSLESIAGKSAVVVRFVPAAGSAAGGIFGLRTLRIEQP